MVGRKSALAVCIALVCALLAVTGIGSVAARATTVVVPASADRPSMSSAGSNSWETAGPYGGSVQALVLSPDFAQDGLALAGGWRVGQHGPTGGYGIARTTDGGGTWALVADPAGAGDMVVYDLAFSSAFAQDQMAYAATGQGLLRSTDRGDTWIRLSGGLPDSDQGNANDIVRIRAAPAGVTAGGLLAVQRAGLLYYSANAGLSWQSVLPGPVSSAGFTVGGASLLAVQQSGSGTKVLRSNNAGASWAVMYEMADGHANDIQALANGNVLLATDSGLLLLVPAGQGFAAGAISGTVPGAVTRLAVAADRIYAATTDGLYAAVSGAQQWSRVPATQGQPFLSVAPCPAGGTCRVVMAGTYSGVQKTLDEADAAWILLPGPYPLPIESIAVSPIYPTDGTLYAATNHGLFRSTDRGASWTLVLIGEPVAGDKVFGQMRISPAYANDGTIYATYQDRMTPRAGLYWSTDRGQTWQVRWGIGGQAALAFSAAYAADSTLFLAADDTLYKSTDAGDSWQSHAMATPGDAFAVSHLAVSPAYASDRTLFASGFGSVRKSVDGGLTWSSTGSYGPAYGLAISPVYGVDGTLWHTYRAVESPGDGIPESGVRRSVTRGTAWGWATDGLPGVSEPFPLSLAVSPDYATDGTLFTALSGQSVYGSLHSIYRSINAGDSWDQVSPLPGNPNVPDLSVARRLGGGLDLFAASSAGVYRYENPCQERVANGGYEADLAWVMPQTGFTASYSTARAHSGTRSLYVGIDGMPDVYSYSAGYQEITIPAGVQEASLSFWWYQVSDDMASATDSRASPSTLTIQAIVDGRMPAEPQVGDWQYVLILDTNGQILTKLYWAAGNGRTWQPISYDLGAFAGQTVRVHFGAFNDGDGRPTAMYVDDVSVTACGTTQVSPPPTITSTPSAPTQIWLPLLFGPYPVQLPAAPTPAVARATHVVTATPSPAATNTPTPKPTVVSATIPTPAAGNWPIPHVVGTVALPQGSHPHAVALGPDGDTLYVSFHGEEHAGRTVGVLSAASLSLLGQIELGPGARGPNGLSVFDEGRRLAVANGQTGEVAVVDLNTRALLAQIPAPTLPYGVTVWGGYGYSANFGANTVTVFDPVTLAILDIIEDAGQQPAQFAVDPDSADLYLSLHGADQVALLRQGQVVERYRGIVQPYGLAFDAAGRRLYVANRGSAHTVTVLDPVAKMVLGTIPLDREPSVLTVNPDSGHLFVACDDVVHVYSTLDWSLVSSIPVPVGAEEGITLDPATDRVYISSQESDAVTVIQDRAAPAVLFASTRDNPAGELYRMLPDGRAQVRLTFTTDAAEDAPAGSPDGRWIAYARHDPGGTWHIWVSDRNGHRTRQITDGAADDIQPAWSGDGRQIAFASQRDGNWEIYTVRPADGHITRLTDHVAGDLGPDWSWTTGRIAFESGRSNAHPEIYSMAADGRDIQHLTSNANGDTGPSWSPDADRLVFYGNRAEQTLYVMQPGGSSVLPLVSLELHPLRPRWAPQAAGNMIVFEGTPNGGVNRRIYRISPTGSQLGVLTPGESLGNNTSPGWLLAP